MSAFKDIVAQDRAAVFLNIDEFGEQIEVNGTTIPVVLDDSTREYRLRGTELSALGVSGHGGIYRERFLFYCMTEDLGEKPRIGRVMTFGGEIWSKDQR